MIDPPVALPAMSNLGILMEFCNRITPLRVDVTDVLRVCGS